MARTALVEISSVRYLTETWDEMYTAIPKSKRLKANSFDNISASEFEKNKAPLISQISLQLKAQTYFPSPLKAHFIPKSSSQDRVICVPTIKDRLVQRAILKYLNSKGYRLNNSISYGFVKGSESGVKKSLERAVELRTNNPWAYKADISSFFDVLDRDRLKEVVNINVRLKTLRKLICLFIDCEIRPESKIEKVKIIASGITQGRGLRQGMPLSPYLANLYLVDFDREIEKKGISLIRYADDIIAFSESRQSCEKIDSICRNLAFKVGLSIHEIGDGQKTLIAAPKETIEFLGIGIKQSSRRGYKQIVTDEKISKMKQRISQFSTIQFCLNNQLTVLNIQPVLVSIIRGYLDAYSDCDNFTQLKHSLSSVYRNTLDTLLTQELGIDRSRLSLKHRQFLTVDENIIL